MVGFLKFVNDYKMYVEVVNHHRPLADCGLSRSGWSPPREGCWRVTTDATVPS